MIKVLIVAAGTLLLLQMQSSLVGGGSYLPIIMSMLLVLCGPPVATLLTYPRRSIIGLLDELSGKGEWEQNRRRENLAGQIRELARIWTAANPREFDLEAVKIANPFLRKGMEMVADGYSTEEIRRILEKSYERYLSGREARLAILASLVRLSQSFGFMGTVVGLIIVLGNLQDTASIGSGVSVALFTTLYGLLFANFIYNPIQRRYAEKIRRELETFPLITEGVLGLAQRESASHIYYKLNSCLDGELSDEPVAGSPLRLALAGCLFPRQGK